ncbi:M24 family metallopeptidase [Scatolibacter rhodanostii]|uniref:M24 family metallopeptidase n=1 Tax=Scatolibacter rhodanostii TaxID=2014781 RepID=UPI00190EE111|nr:aminopeptidase P family protein [Scatolibacter rhodanostii]
MNDAVMNLKNALLHGDSQKAGLILSPVNRRYLTGFPSSAGAVLLTEEETYLLVDFRYFEAAQKAVKHCKVLRFDSLNEKITELLKKHVIKEVYFEQESLFLGQFKRLEKACYAAGADAIDDATLDRELIKLRAVKTPGEIRKIEQAQEITDASFEHILPFIREGATEKEIALEIELFMRKQGADGVAFDLIVVSGVNSSLPHGVPSQKVIQNGDFVTMDTGALLDGYHSDMTRTVAVGSVSPAQRDVYETVLQAHLAVVDNVKPGVQCSEMDKVARNIIDAKYPGTFGHGLGHGVGLDIHEEPRFSRLDSTICKPGMVITDEPGIYLPGEFGVRIEDMLLVTEDGCRSLTHSPKELIIL